MIMNLKEFMKKPSLNKRRFLLVFFITMITACLPLFTVNCIQGHDIQYHLLRIEALKVGIQNGLPFLRVNMLFFGGAGYASSMFYPDFLLYIPALLRIAGFEINSTFHIFITLCIAASFFTCYFSVKEITNEQFPALIAAVIYILTQYHLDDVYVRCAVGEITAFIFIPLVIAGLHDLALKEFKKPWLLGIGMAGVLLCHTLSTLFCLVLCVIAFIFALPHIIRKPAILIKLAITAVICMAITSFYWLPMIEQMRSTVFKYTKSEFDVAFEALLFKDVFADAWPGIGIAPFIFLLPAFFISHKEKLIRFSDACTVAGMGAVLCTTRFFPWKRFANILKSIQFPWRLFIMATALLSVSGAIYCWKYVKEASEERKEINNTRYRGIALMLVLGIMVVSAVNVIGRTEIEYYSYSGDYYDYEPFTESVIAGEWLPDTVEVRDSIGKHVGEAYTDSNTLSVTRDRNTLTVADLSGTEKYVDVPFTFYLGYAATDENGNQLKVDGTGKNGRVRVYPDGASSVHVYYAGTELQHMADILSAVTLAGLTIYMIIIFRKKFIRQK